MALETRATKGLDQAGIAYDLRTYPYDPDVDSIGLAAANALGVDPGQVFKTLMVTADGKPAFVVAPSDGEVSMKRVAAALGVWTAAIMKPADAERVSRYKIGGISPFGHVRKIPVVLDETALLWDTIYVNGGQRGLQVCLTGQDAVQVLGATVADIRQLR